STFITSAGPTLTRWPTTPCRAGGTPVAIDVSAAAVVDGTTDEIGPPVMPASVVADATRSRSCAQPSPSSTRRTTWVAPSSAGNHAGRPWSRASRAGTTLLRHGPRESGTTISTAAAAYEAAGPGPPA